MNSSHKASIWTSVTCVDTSSKEILDSFLFQVSELGLQCLFRSYASKASRALGIRIEANNTNDSNSHPFRLWNGHQFRHGLGTGDDIYVSITRLPHSTTQQPQRGYKKPRLDEQTGSAWTCRLRLASAVIWHFLRVKLPSIRALRPQSMSSTSITITSWSKGALQRALAQRFMHLTSAYDPGRTYSALHRLTA